MKPAAFEYRKPRSIEETTHLLASMGSEAKILAGGQSLVPMMNMRISSPEALIDVNALPDVGYIKTEDDQLRIGLLARHVDIERSEEAVSALPILGTVVKDIAHLAIRNRGTFVGSLAHNDPAAEWPLIAVLLDAEIEAVSQSGRREISASDFFESYLTTSLEPEELVTEARLPLLPDDVGWGFLELSRRKGDFAMVAVAAILRIEGERVREARIALGGVGYCAYRDEAAERLLVGERPSTELWNGAAQVAEDNADPGSDVHASAGYRKHLVGELTRRVLADAHARATGRVT